MPSPEIAKLLDNYSSNALVQMASFLGVMPKQKEKGKSFLINLISERITDPQRIREELAKISKAERALLDAVLRRGGQTSVRNVRAELARMNLIDPTLPVEFGEYSLKNRPDPRIENSKRFEDLLARLMIRGLVFSGDESGKLGPYQNKLTFYDMVSKVYIPEPLRRSMPEPTSLPVKEENLAELQTVQEGSARVFQRELYLYWSYVRDHSIVLTQKQEIVKQALKDLNGLLLVRGEVQTGKTENDYPRLRFLRSMLIELGLVRVAPNQTLEALQSDFFSLDPAERVRKTYQKWLDTSQFNELVLLPETVRPRFTAANSLIPARPGLVSARNFVIDQVRKLKRKDWVPLETLIARVNDQDYEFLLKRREFPGYYNYGIANPYGADGNEFFITFPGIIREEQGWDKVEANLIRGMISGPLYWMGLVDLGWTGKEEGSPAAFRFTALGAWVFGLGKQPEIPTEGGRVIVQPNMQITALDPIQDAVLANLDRFSERLSAERAVEYRLTRASVYVAQQAGWDAERIKALLEQYSNASLPPNVTRTLEEWQAQYERILIHPKVTLMHGDPQAVSLVAQNPASEKWIAARPLPEVALLKSAQSVNKVTDLLRSKEIFPVINTRAAIQPNAVTCSETGEIRFNSRLASLYLHGHLAPFANPHGEGYQITSDSVQRAVRSGLTAPEITQRLEAVHSGPLPEKLVRSIRSWAKHYGSAVVAPVVLLQVRDDAALNELLADPEVGKLIKRFTPRPAALAQVAPENVEKLRALLAEMGVELEKRLK
jgi:hypothetical protein